MTNHRSYSYNILICYTLYVIYIHSISLKTVMSQLFFLPKSGSANCTSQTFIVHFALLLRWMHLCSPPLPINPNKHSFYRFCFVPRLDAFVLPTGQNKVCNTHSFYFTRGLSCPNFPFYYRQAILSHNYLPYTSILRTLLYSAVRCCHASHQPE